MNKQKIKKIHLSKTIESKKYKQIKIKYTNDILKLMGQIIVEYYIIKNEIYKTEKREKKYEEENKIRKNIFNVEEDKDNIFIKKEEDKEKEIYKFIEEIFEIEDKKNEIKRTIGYNLNDRYSNEELKNMYKSFIKNIKNKILENKYEINLNKIKEFIINYVQEVLKSKRCEELDKIDKLSFYDSRNYSIYALYQHYIQDDANIRLYYVIEENKENAHYMGHVFVIKEKEDIGYNLQFIGIQQSLLLFMQAVCEKKKFGISYKLFNEIENTESFRDAKIIYAYAYKVISDILVKKYGFTASMRYLKTYNMKTKEMEYEEEYENDRPYIYTFKENYIYDEEYDEYYY